jgi:hypothetical protein
MAIVFESIPLRGLRKAHLEQLLWNLEQQVMMRQYELIELFTWARDYAYSEGVILPKKESE